VTARAGAKAGHSDPVVLNGRAIAQRIKGTPGNLATKMMFNNFLISSDKFYNKEEYEFRLSVFADSLKRIDALNAEGLNVTFGVTSMADLTLDEIRAMLPPLPAYEKVNASPAPAMNGIEPENGAVFDWATSGKMNAIQNQANCGSCWAFSASGALETTYAYKCGRSVVKLSEQFLVDCDYKDNGCNGGWPHNAWQYVSARGGQALASAYPYTATRGSCKPISSLYDNVGSSYTSLSGYSNQQVADFIKTTGPVACALNVDENAFSAYKGGIDPGRCCHPTQPNHAMIISGYGNDNGVNYWIIRNSWGTRWGASGYYKLQWGYCNVVPYLEAPQPRC